MTDPRYMKAPRQRHDELQDEIDKYLHENPDLVARARYVSTLLPWFRDHHHYKSGNPEPLPSVLTLRRRLTRVRAGRCATGLDTAAIRMARLRACAVARPPRSTVRLPGDDPARGFRRPHARPVLCVDLYTGAIISAP